MGKPKYYVGQILKNRTTGEIHYINHISIKNPDLPVVIYTVPPLSKRTFLTPNDVLKHWVIGPAKLTKQYQIVTKIKAKELEKMAELLYDKT